MPLQLISAVRQHNETSVSATCLLACTPLLMQIGSVAQRAASLCGGQVVHRSAIQEDSQLLGAAAIGVKVHAPVPKVLILLQQPNMPLLPVCASGQDTCPLVQVWALTACSTSTPAIISHMVLHQMPNDGHGSMRAASCEHGKPREALSPPHVTLSPCFLKRESQSRLTLLPQRQGQICTSSGGDLLTSAPGG